MSTPTRPPCKGIVYDVHTYICMIKHALRPYPCAEAVSVQDVQRGHVRRYTTLEVTQGANLKSISHRCYLFEVAFVWELTGKNYRFAPGSPPGRFKAQTWTCWRPLQAHPCNPCTLIRKQVFFFQIRVLGGGGSNDHAKLKSENGVVKQNRKLIHNCGFRFRGRASEQAEKKNCRHLGPKTSIS